MGFRLVPKSVTLNGIMAVILCYFAEFGRFGGRLCQSGRRQTYTVCNKCSPKNVVFSDISLMAKFAEVTENGRIIESHLRNIHPLLDYDASESQSTLSV